MANNPPGSNWGHQGQGQGRGGPPAYPTHCTDQYYQGKEDPNQGYEEQYYANREEHYYGEGQEQYYKEGQAECKEQYLHQAETEEQEEEPHSDTHWLDEFQI